MKFQDLTKYCDNSQYPEFAKNEWINIEHNRKEALDFHIDFHKIPEYFRHIILILHTLKDDNALAYIYVVNELYNNGVKVVKPTFEQCLAFENIDVNITLVDYEQPFPTVAIELPDKYKSSLMSRFGVKVPICIISHFNTEKKYRISAMSFGTNNQSISCYMPDSSDSFENVFVRTYEEQIKGRNDKDFLIFTPVERVCVNLLSFMTDYGHNRIGYENIKQHRFYERKKPGAAKQDIYYIALKQEIKLFNTCTIRSKGDENGEQRASPKPFWRRGHRRLQHYGPANSLKKIVFIRPVLVCSEKYIGELSDTKVTYK